MRRWCHAQHAGELPPPGRFARLFVVASIILVAGLRGDARFAGEPAASPPGIHPHRGYFSEFPFERIDTFDGTLSLEVPLLELPGNAGMDLRVTAAYAGQWTIGLPDVPVFVTTYDTPTGGGRVTMGDGAVRSLHRDHPWAPDVSVTPESWRWERGPRRLKLPDGRVASFEPVAGDPDGFRLARVDDAFGNAIVPHWQAPYAGQQLMGSVDLQTGSVVRTVAFDWNIDWAAARIMSVRLIGGGPGGGDRTWTFNWWTAGRLSAIAPPAGPGWQFSYSGSGAGPSGQVTVTTPHGGTVQYTLHGVTPTGAPGILYQRVVQRSVGGRAVAPATWTFNYGPLTAGTRVVYVVRPNGDYVHYYHVTAQPDEIVGPNRLLTALSVANESASSWTTWTHVAVPVTDEKSAWAVAQQTIQVGGRSYTTTLEYDGPSHRGHHHQPHRVVETGELTRETTRTFRCAFAAAYRTCLPASTTVTVGAEPAATSATHNDYGFMTAETAAGVTTQFAQGPDGNVASTTDGNGATTAFGYDRGVVTTTAGSEKQRFTGKDRDAETFLDYFGARYYRNVTGRFGTIDPVITVRDNLIDPQRWNRYAYVRNNPLRFVDPDGRIIGTLWDLISLGISAKAVLQQPSRGGNWIALGADVLSVLAPGIPAIGMAIRGGSKVDNAVDAARALERTSQIAARTHWGNAKTLADHFQRHGGDFAAKSAAEYAQMASDFLRRAQAERLPTKIGPDGTIRVYDPKQNIFAAFNKDGTTRTFYRPDPKVHGKATNMDYWNDQPGVLWTR